MTNVENVIYGALLGVIVWAAFAIPAACRMWRDHEDEPPTCGWCGRPLQRGQRYFRKRKEFAGDPSPEYLHASCYRELQVVFKVRKEEEGVKSDAKS